MNETQGRMTDDDLSAALVADFDDAVSFIDSDIAPARILGTEFYLGEPFGDEEDGRSQVVMPVVRDAVRQTLPSLVKTFFGGRRVLYFVGNNPQSAAQQNIMTEAVHAVFERHNPGFMIAWSAFKDALVRKVGFIKWWWDDSTEVSARLYGKVSEDELLALQADPKPGEEYEVVDATEIEPASFDEVLGIEVPAQYTYTVRCVHRKKNARVRVAAVPPEEIVVDRDASCPQEARLFGHRTLKTRGSLVAMGISPELLAECSAHEGGSTSLGMNTERMARAPGSVLRTQATNATYDQDLILFCDLWYRIDYDGDGIGELRRIVTVGDDHKIVSNDYADEVTIAALCPDPEPHVMFGLGYFDNLGDMQVIESHVMRDVLDSLKASIFPRTVYVEGQVNSADVLNTEIGAAIRARQPGMVQPLEVPFVGQQALPILELLDQIKERRTGVRGSSPLLDGKALQSTNQVAVNAAVTGAQAQVEMIARLFAETGFKRVFRGILKMLVEHQEVPLMVPVNGELKPVNPKDWNIDVEVETTLGSGFEDEQRELLKQISADQTAVLLQFGPDNPLTSVQHLYNTQARLLEMHGMRDVHRYWRDPSTYEAPPEEEPEPTPEQVIAEAQMAIEAGKLDLEQLKIILDDDFRRDEMEVDMILRAKDLAMKYNTTLDVEAIRAMTERNRLKQDAQQHGDKIMLDAAKAEAAASKPGPDGKGPRRKTLKAIRDAAGRIQAVEESEEVKPHKVIRKAVRDESGRIVAVEEQEDN